MRTHDLYEQDFYAWTRAQAKELRRFARMRPNLPLDLGHIALEIGDLGKEQRNALRSWSTRIIEHLLLLEHARAEDPRAGWIDEIGVFRRDIELPLTGRQSPVHGRNRRRSQPNGAISTVMRFVSS